MTVGTRDDKGGGKKLRVAVIGSGLAGLTTAYLLRQQGLEVWILEKSAKIGFHSSSVVIPPTHLPGEADDCSEKIGDVLLEKSEWTVDVPMRSFQGGYYPLLIALYRHLQIPLLPTFYTFSFSSIPSNHTPKSKSPGSTYFIYSGASGLSFPALPSPYLRDAYAILLGMLSFGCMAACFVLWSVIAFLAYHDILPSPINRSTPLKDLASRISSRLERPLGSLVWTPLGSLWGDFIARIVIPIFSAVGTMTSQNVLDTPIGCLLDYAHTTIGTPHYTLAPGFTASSVADRLVAPIKAQGEGYVRLDEAVDFLRMEGGSVIVGTKKEVLEVDKVVIATQPSVARALLSMLEVSYAREGEKEQMRRVQRMTAAIEQVESRETIVVSHRDTNVLPPSSDRREINLHLPDTPRTASTSRYSVAGPSRAPYFPPAQNRIYTMATHVISPPRHLRARYDTVLQTTNPVVPIDEDKVISVARLERALPLKESKTTLQAIYPPSPSGSPPSVYLVGSYAYPGIPLLEGCVGSALRTVGEITGGTGEVDWDAGRGSMIGRLWRWRRESISSF